MKIALNEKQSSRRAFTLIEMIGVLAVIAILAALLIPKIFTAIGNAQINSTAESIATVKTALADHYSKYGSLLSTNGNPVSAQLPSSVTNYDLALVSEGFLEKPFSCAIGDPSAASVELVPIIATNSTVSVAGLLSAADATASDFLFNLVSTNTGTSTVTGTAEIVVFIPNVLESDAKALNDVIDGPALGVPLGSSTGDLYGRVKYTAVNNNRVNVLVYVTSR